MANPDKPETPSWDDLLFEIHESKAGREVREKAIAEIVSLRAELDGWKAHAQVIARMFQDAHAELSKAAREERLNLQTVTAYASGYEAGQVDMRERAVGIFTHPEARAVRGRILALPIEEG